MRSWLLYILAGLIEIYPPMKYQLVTINRSWDSTLAKNLNLVFGEMDGCTYGQPERTVQGCRGIKMWHYSKAAFWYEICMTAYTCSKRNKSLGHILNVQRNKEWSCFILYIIKKVLENVKPSSSLDSIYPQWHLIFRYNILPKKINPICLCWTSTF